MWLPVSPADKLSIVDRRRQEGGGGRPRGDQGRGLAPRRGRRGADRQLGRRAGRRSAGR
ncbi:MAG: hypothetical protein MZV63_06180 [Marinilabiliales bacterium]|nr:hypothetical protein [Marinilabiliales bacterium]